MAKKTEQEEQAINPLALGAHDLLIQESKGYWTGIWEEVRKRPTAVIAIWVLIFLALVAIFAPFISNHRPFYSITPVTGDNGTVSKDLAFPLFGAMSFVDWALLSGFASFVWLVIWRRFILKTKGRGNPIVIGLFIIFSVLPIVWGLLDVPWDWEPSRLPGMWWWIAFSAVGFFGFLFLIWGVLIVATGRRDAFNRDLTGQALRSLFAGSLLLVISGSAYGTLDRPELDRTDYYKKYALAPEDGASALFPPIPHNFLASQSYVRKQPPLSPKLRVVSSGGSLAATALCLDDTSREEGTLLPDTIFENGASVPLTVDTPLSVLNEGEGVEVGQRSYDFVVVTHDLSTIRIRLRGAETVGDVINAMNEAAVYKRTGVERYRATLDPSFGIRIEDLTKRRPIHWAGTEDSGADVGARLIIATRVALSIGFVSTGIAVIIGVIFGAIIGYFGGWVDFIGMRIIEIFMAIPRLFLLLTIIAFLPPKWSPYMLYAMMVVIGLTSWMPSARFIRAEFFRLRETDYVQAAKACGLPLRSILFKHMLPNGITPVLVSASFGVAAAIFVETGLSFLGFGIKPPNPSWGQMLNEAIDQSTGVFNWWLAIFPGILIFLTVFSFNLIGDALRDAIDPKLKKASAV